MAYNPVGICTSITSSTSTAQSTVFSHQTPYLRVVAVSADAHIAIGTNPIATPANYYVTQGEPEIISVGKPMAQRVVGIITGATTTIDFPEGTGSPFAVGDAVQLTVTGQSGYNFSNKIVLSVNDSSGVAGYFGTRIVVDADTSSGAPSPTRDGLGTYAELRGNFKVAALGTGSGKVYLQQVQTSGSV